MNLVLGFAQLLEMDQPDPLTPAQRKSVRHILNEGEYLLRIIDELLDIARIEAGEMEVSPDNVDVSAVAEELHNLCAPLAAQHHVQIKLDASIHKQTYVRADQGRLHQVLLNLVSNAIKYNRADGEVSLSCQRQDQQSVCIYVEDTGIGIPPENLDKLFTPFVRLDGEREQDGTGLGLALSKRLVELMNGDIGVESKPGRGSTFWIELPLADRDSVRQESDGQKDESRQPSPPASTLLYIEDYDANIELLQVALDDYPQVELIRAKDGESGLVMASQQSPDLILLDLQLPDTHGYEVLKQLQEDENTREIPVVVVSADATPRQIEHLKDAGALDYTTKPIDMKAFLGNLRAWLS